MINLGKKINKYKNNPTEECEIEEFTLDTLQDCLDYYKQTKDIDALESKIYEIENKIENAIRNLNNVIVGCRLVQYDETANVLCQIRNSLKL